MHPNSVRITVQRSDNMKTSNKKRHLRTRDYILDCAKKLLKKEGRTGFSLRGVARAAEFSPSSLYEYFPNKDTIIMIGWVAHGQHALGNVIEFLRQ